VIIFFSFSAQSRVLEIGVFMLGLFPRIPLKLHSLWRRL